MILLKPAVSQTFILQHQQVGSLIRLQVMCHFQWETLSVHPYQSVPQKSPCLSNVADDDFLDVITISGGIEVQALDGS